MARAYGRKVPKRAEPTVGAEQAEGVRPKSEDETCMCFSKRVRAQKCIYKKAADLKKVSLVKVRNR